MAIPVILRGDTSSIIRLSVAEGDYTDCILEVSFFGVLRQFKNVVGNSVITLEWTADETANFPLGTNRLLVSIRRDDFVRTLPFPKVKVTDAPAEVYEGTIEIAPKLFDLPDLTAESSLGEVKTTLNAIKDVLRGGLALFLSVILLSSNAAELTPDTLMDDVKGSTTISEFVTAAGVTVGGGTDGEAVTNIVEGMIIYKRDMYDLSFGGEYCWEITEGEDVTIAPYQYDNKYYFKGNFALHKWYQVNEIYDEKTKQYKVIFSTYGMTPTSPPGITKEITSDASITSFDFGTIKGVKKRFAKDTIALKSEIPTDEKVKETVVQTVRETNGGVWDQKLEVWWTPKMENGKLTYQATTNVNLKAEN